MILFTGCFDRVGRRERGGGVCRGWILAGVRVSCSAFLRFVCVCALNVSDVNGKESMSDSWRNMSTAYDSTSFDTSVRID